MQNTNFSFWEHQTFLNSNDVIIIGAGIVGLNAALNLKIMQPSLKITVLEQGLLPSGASTKNAGFACFGSVSELIQEIADYGEETVFNLVEKRVKGLALLRENLGDHNIDYLPYGGNELFFKADLELETQSLDAISYLNKLLKPAFKHTDTFTVSNDKIAAFGLKNINTLIHNKHEGQIDTGKMMKALTQKVLTLGVNLFNSCQVLDFSAEGKGYRVNTNQATFFGKKLILANNAFATQLIPDLAIRPARGQVLVTQEIKGLKLKGTFHYNKGFTYFRNIGNRILIGGGRNLDVASEETYDLTNSAPIINYLKELLANCIDIKQAIEYDYMWSGIMGFGNKLEPIIEKVEPNLYVAARCNGMGVAIGSLTGKEIAELVAQEL
jgi:glycine/D-amino acid oxidase-like deaminating enzyme